MKPREITIVLFDADDLDPLETARHCEHLFRAKVTVRQGGIDSLSAYDASRRQFDAMRLLAPLEAFPGDRVLGLTSVDLFLPIFTFVFGVARLGGRACVLSSARLDDRDARDRDELLSSRLVKEATHELGHTFGLKHCLDPECVMSVSSEADEVDTKSALFCPSCERLLDPATVRA